MLKVCSFSASPSYTQSCPAAAVGAVVEPGQAAVGGAPAAMKVGAGALASGIGKEIADSPAGALKYETAYRPVSDLPLGSCVSSGPAFQDGDGAVVPVLVGYAAGVGSGRTITVSAIGMISVTGRSAREACSRIFSGLEAS